MLRIINPVLALAALLAACGPVYETQYTLVPPATEIGRQCANNCLLAQQNCRQSCSSQQQLCESNAHLQAQNGYLQYANERQRNGQPVKKTESDFYYDDCEHSDCDERCGNDYRICHTNCGGQVIPRTVCTAFCN